MLTALSVWPLPTCLLCCSWLGDGLIQLSTMYYLNYFSSAGLRAFDWDVAGRPLAFLAGEILLYSAMVPRRPPRQPLLLPSPNLVGS